MHISKLTNLRSLEAYVGEGFTDAGLAHFSSLATLESLCIGARSVTNDGLVYLSSLKRLRSLDFRMNSCVTRECLVHLTGLTRLTCFGAGRDMLAADQTI